jgi:predicted CoA-binding protein
MTDDNVQQFLAGDSFAVVGASPNRDKYGNKVLRVYQQNERTAFPVNPNEEEVEGLKAYPDLTSLPQTVHGISIITQPAVTEKVIDEAIQLGIKHVWMQPGAESDKAVRAAEEAGMNVIWGGPCVLVVLRFRDR